MIIPDYKIAAWAGDGGVTPYDPNLVNPASLDLRLGNEIRLPHAIWQTLSVEAQCMLHDLNLLKLIPRWGEPMSFSTYLLKPREFVLCASLEFVNLPDDMAALLYSKSSAGRRGIEHLHAGFGDPGWHSSQWTWELHNVAPWVIPLVAGERLMQQVMIKLTDSPVHTYRETGRYNQQFGPTPERES